MKKMILAFLAFGTFAQVSNAQIKVDLKKAAENASKVIKDKTGAGTGAGAAAALTNDDIGGGLKQALTKGATNAVEKLSLTDGYLKSALYKIAIPEDMKNVISKLSKVPGFQNIEEQIMEKMNRGAEKAAVQAKPIFVNAIKSLTIQDAMNILMGEKNAATEYLKTSTNDALYGEFSPIIENSLSEVGATKYWSDAVNAYNRLPKVKKANPDLKDYVTKEALKGLYGMVAEKELEIRKNPALRTTDLLKKVFSKQDSKPAEAGK
jgi:hypothetical protein